MSDYSALDRDIGHTLTCPVAHLGTTVSSPDGIREVPMFTPKRALRIFSLMLLSSGLILASLQAASANAAEGPLREYRLRLFHTHTNERINIVYRRGDVYIPEAVNRLDQFLRDHRTGDVRQLDERLFDLLHDLSESLGKPGAEIDIVCGYRTPWSNEFLRTRTPLSGVAVHSLHMEGEAIDIRMPGVSTSRLRNAALILHRGGVGFYPTSQFVHVDVGRVRRW
jgi:uncharacterized protein YcbK (DUF882 family)